MLTYSSADSTARRELTYDNGSDGSQYYKGLRIQAMAEVHVFLARQLLETLPHRARILDVASGTGSFAQRLIDLGFDVHCTSWNQKLRVEAPTYKLNLDEPFSPTDVGGQSFDCVVASEIIEHVENPSVLLRSCRAVLSGEGLLIVSTPNVASIACRLQWLRRGYPEIFNANEVVTNRHISMQWDAGFTQIALTAGFAISARHIMVELRRPWLKRHAYRLLSRLLGPSSAGETILYFLRPSPERAQSHGPETVY